LTSLVQYDRILGQQQLPMVNYACGFNQSETGKYFELIIISLHLILRTLFVSRIFTRNARYYEFVPLYKKSRVSPHFEIVILLLRF